MYRRSLLLAALLAALFVAGCGSSASPPSTAVPPAATIPASSIKAPLESARTPEGAKGADQTHYTNSVELPLTLTGSSIRIDTAGVDLIAGFENVYQSVYCPYYDPYGRVWSRAFGETDWSGNFGGRCISHSQAIANVHYLVEAQYQYAVRGLGTSFNQHQVDALDSFVWNLGAGIFTGSLRSAIQRHDPYPMLAYDIAGGQVLSGLAARRREEVALFLRPEAQPKPESHAQHVAKLKRELAGHEYELVHVLRPRQKVLRRELAKHGCYPRLKAHRAGPTCQRWKREGNEVSAKGKYEDGVITTLRREIG